MQIQAEIVKLEAPSVVFLQGIYWDRIPVLITSKTHRGWYCITVGKPPCCETCAESSKRSVIRPLDRWLNIEHRLGGGGINFQHQKSKMVAKNQIEWVPGHMIVFTNVTTRELNLPGKLRLTENMTIQKKSQATSRKQSKCTHGNTPSDGLFCTNSTIDEHRTRPWRNYCRETTDVSSKLPRGCSATECAVACVPSWIPQYPQSHPSQRGYRCTNFPLKQRSVVRFSFCTD